MANLQPAPMIVPNGVTFNVVDDNTGKIMGAYESASVAAQNMGVDKNTPTYQIVMAEAKAEYEAWLRSTEDSRLTSIEEGEE